MHEIKPIKVIGIAGEKRCGKDTAASYLVEKYGYTRIAFADRLKAFVNTTFSFANTSDEWKETKQLCLVKEDALYKEIKKLGVHSDDINDLAMQLFQLMTIHGEDTEVCDVGFYTLISYRKALQIVGTDMFRYYSDTFWLDRLPLTGNKKFVVSDARFSNEIAFLKVRGADIWKIERDGLNNNDVHVSENSIHNGDVDIIFKNNSTLEDLYKQIDEEMNND